MEAVRLIDEHTKADWHTNAVQKSNILQGNPSSLHVSNTCLDAVWHSRRQTAMW